MRIKVFTCFIIWINQLHYIIQIRYIENFPSVFYHCENVIWFFTHMILFLFLDNFYCMQVYCENLFLYCFWLIPKLRYIFLKIHHLSSKRTYIQFLKISPICTLFGSNIHKVQLSFTIFVTNKLLRTIFTKGNFIRYYYFIKIYIVYEKRFFLLGKFVFLNFSITKLDNFFIHLYTYF